MKKIILSLLLLVTFLGFSQKIKLKDHVVLVDNVAWLNYQDCGAFDSTCSLLDKNNEEIIFFKFNQIDGVEPITPSNVKGTLFFVEVKFLGYNKSFEIKKSQKDIIQLLYNAKVINENGELDEEKASRVIEKYGSEYSARLNKNTNNTQTIIIKDEPTRSGININLGR